MLGGGTYNAYGIKAIADAIAVSPSLTKISLAKNNLGSEGAKALAPAIRDSPSLTYLWYNLRTQTSKLLLEDGAVLLRAGGLSVSGRHVDAC